MPSEKKRTISSGSKWEAQVASLLSDLSQYHTIMLTEAPTIVIKGRPIRKAKGMLDFEGGWMQADLDGLTLTHVGFDAKEVSEPRLNFKSKIKDHQVERMRKIISLGGGAGIVIHYDLGEDERMYGLPAAALIRMIDRGDKSVKWSEVEDQGGRRLRCAQDLFLFLDDITHR